MRRMITRLTGPILKAASRTRGYNARFVGPRLFRAMEDEQLYVHPHVHTHQMLRDRFARIEADLRKDEELDAEFKALEGYDD